jgi:streptomycin 6-kinase
LGVLDVPAGLQWWSSQPEGADWLAALPQIVDAALDRWSLRLGAVFEAPRMIGFVASVQVGEAATPAVLKINMPHRESEHEADALAHWDGHGAARLLASEPREHALLLERCLPGTPLWKVDDEDAAMHIAASVLRRIWRPPPKAHAFASLADEARRWGEKLPRLYDRLGRPFEHALLDTALAAIRELAADQADFVVVHQDLHGGNVLRAEREPWLIIDPKPLVGERAFDVASLLRDRRSMLSGPSGASFVRRRLDILVDELGLDRERMRLWGIVHALAWGAEDGDDQFDLQHVHVARLLASC